MGMLLVLSCALSAGLGTFLHGYNAGVISHIITNPHFNKYFSTQSSSPVLGAIVSVFAGGAALGSIFSGFLLDSYGRRKTIQVGAVISILGCVLQSASMTLTMMLLGRIISGFAVGMMSVGVPVYLAEIAFPSSRGFLMGFSQLMILMGFVFSSWVGYASHNVPATGNNPFTWRFPIAIAAIPAVFITFSLQWLPESPRYLVRQGLTEQAYRAMMKLYHDGGNRDEIAAQVAEVAGQWKREAGIRAVESDWVVMFKVKAWRRRVLNSMLPSVFTQFTGINIITYYQTASYNTLGFSQSKSLLQTAIYHTIAPLATLIFMTFIVDSIGRRKPLLYGSVILPIIFVIYAAIQSQNEDRKNRGASTAAIALMFIYNLVFSFSFGPVGWTYVEVIPLRLRGKGTALAVGVGNWMANVLVSQVSPSALEAISWRYYIVFAAFNLLVTLPTLFFLMKEPRKLSLERLDELWDETPTTTTTGASTGIELAKGGFTNYGFGHHGSGAGGGGKFAGTMGKLHAKASTAGMGGRKEGTSGGHGHGRKGSLAGVVGIVRGIGGVKAQGQGQGSGEVRSVSRGVEEKGKPMGLSFD